MRSRNIKPGFFKNDALGEMEPLSRILFAGLWCYADKAGRFEWRPKRMKAEILPYDNGDLTVIARPLIEQGFVVRYSVNENEYGQVVNFDTHQHPHHTEKDSKIPPLDPLTVNSPLDNGYNPSDSLIPDSLIQEDPSSEPPSADSDEQVEVILSVPLIKKDGDLHIVQSDVDGWQETYPGVEVMQELREYRQWCIDNPTKRKTKGGVRRSISSWLGKRQNRGGGGGFQNNGGGGRPRPEKSNTPSNFYNPDAPNPQQEIINHYKNKDTREQAEHEETKSFERTASESQPEQTCVECPNFIESKKEDSTEGFCPKLFKDGGPTHPWSGKDCIFFGKEEK